ncbi:hypothetical protein ACPV6E_01110 [Corynebacterium propinquum]|uniref:Uncharacterized protein n=1 Tax=Corynebacterium propinquum TaxID=43769 RepID=A0AAP4FA58_9CORY|nr:hypothetical protein [Corynebacterium propinquum]MCG7231236.1 hypothetical protein [Corynebacterium propinquum]MDK4300720.1 hypothetical protein [Corynebacterium propinquum]MDK4313993.1 hypothetical protein [Corynebacterium propinquum]MDK4320599.1 hypothetical protein [Corynebacterium propinquum]MDK4325121.1 hypothetical protein [Corynebacterium propinquum]
MTSSVGQTRADVRPLKDDAEQAQPGVEFSVVEEITINFPIALLDANVLYPNIFYLKYPSVYLHTANPNHSYGTW